MPNPSAFKRTTRASRIFFVTALSTLAVIVVVAIGAVVVSLRPIERTIVSTDRRKSATAATISAAARERAQAAYAALPVSFVPSGAKNQPAGSQPEYMARGNGYKLLLTSSHAALTLAGKKSSSEVLEMVLDKRRGAARTLAMLKHHGPSSQGEMVAAYMPTNVQMNFVGINPSAAIIAEGIEPGKVNYFLGSDPSQWRANIPTYGRVSYRDVYPGINLVFHAAARQLEFDYCVSAGADSSAIALSFDGVKNIRTDNDGNLILATTAGPLSLLKPVAYQMKSGIRETVDAHFSLRGRKAVAFALGSYDHNRELVIDPVVTYATYFGGNQDDFGISIAVDGSGNAYVAGATDSDTIPGPSGTTVAPNNNGAGAGTAFDTFVTKISPTGTCLFTTFFGGSDDDFPGAIAIDSAGIYIAGTTDSSDFPVTSGAVQHTFLGGTSNGNNDAYAVKLALDGSSITWATYIAGSDSDSGLGVAVDNSHNVYVAGETWSSNLGGATGGVNPLPNGGALNLGKGTHDDDGFIVKLNSDGTAYDLVSYIGGSNGDLATAVALDASGNIYVAGETISPDFPVTAGVVQSKCGTDGNCNASNGNSFDDAFIVSIPAGLSSYNYATFYGGSKTDEALAIVADSGSAFLTGLTSSSDFPTANTPYQNSLAGAQNAFVVELNSTGSQATQATYFGGNGTDTGDGITLDASQNVYLTGQTSSSNFPLSINANQGALSGNTDAFVSTLKLSTNTLVYSTYLGGGGDEDQFAGSIAVDSGQNVYVTGDTDSGNGSTSKFPITSGALESTYGGGSCASGSTTVPCSDAFIAAYSPVAAPDFGITATAFNPPSVSPGGSATSTITITPVNGYSGTVDLACNVTGSGSPLPQCSLSPTSGNSSTLTVTTTGAAGTLFRRSKIFYALWLPVVGLALAGMRLSGATSSRRKLVGFLLLCVIMSILFFLPACGSSSSSGGGGGGCTGCTAEGSYSITVTGTDSANTNLTHTLSPPLTLTVN